MFYLTGGLISRVGDLLSGFAFLFLAQDLTHSGMHTTGIVIAQTVPYLLFGLLGGVVADWANKRKLLFWIDLIRAPIVLSVFAVQQMGLLTYWYLLVVGFVIQSFGCFFNPAHRSVLPLIVPEADRVAANGFMDSAVRGATVFSPVFTMYMIQNLGPASFFALDAVSYLLSALLIFLLKFKEVANDTGNRMNRQWLFPSIRDSLLDFFRWAKGERTIGKLFRTTFFVVFCNTWVWEVGLFLYVDQFLSNSNMWYSGIKGWFGGVVIVTNIIIPLIFKRMTLRTYLYGSLIWGTGILALGFANQLWQIFACVLIVGVGFPLAGLSRVYLLQQLLPKDKLGRGFSVNSMLLYLANVVSLSLFGWLAEWLPIHFLMLASGSAMLLISISYLHFDRKAPGESPYARLNS